MRTFIFEDIDDGPLLTFLPAARSALSRTEESQTVEYQHGRLEHTAVYEGQHKSGYSSTISEYRFDYTVECRIQLHDDLPCGFAAGKMTWVWSAVKPDGTIEETQERRKVEYVLQDLGEGAKSDLPDSN